MNIKERVLKEMPMDLGNLEIARYIYLKLGTLLNFSTKFKNTVDHEMGLMYTESIDINTFKRDEVICRTWCQLYSSLLDAVGIENRIVDYGHQYVVFKCDGVFYIADATTSRYNDLARIKFGSETSYFGVALRQDFYSETNAYNELDERNSVIAEIDKKIPFYQERVERKKLLDEKLKPIKESNMSLKEKMEKMFSLIGTLYAGYYESKDFVYTVEKGILNEEELHRVHSAPLKRTKSDLNVDIIDCLYLYDNGYKYYLLYPNQPIKEVKEKDLIKLSWLGYGLDEKKIPGIDYPKTFIPGKVKHNIKYMLCKIFNPKEVSFIKDYDGKKR